MNNIPKGMCSAPKAKVTICWEAKAARQRRQRCSGHRSKTHRTSRLGYTSTEYDLVIGNMAGGGANLKSKFSKFRRASMSIAEVMSIMKHDLTSTNLGLQYAFLTEKALSKLTLIDTEMVEREDAV